MAARPSRFLDMPKVELHLHLEGAVPPAAMLEAIRRHGDDEVDARVLADRYVFRDFADFVDTWVWKNRYLDSLATIEYVAEAVAAELVAHRVVYAEAFFSPTDFAEHGLAPQELALAWRRGLDRVPGSDVALIVDLVRDTGPDRAARTFDQVREVAEEARIVGVGIGGIEDRFPPALFQPVYRRARSAGFHLTAHAGETAGPPSVWSALRDLGVERIGHGVRAVEDPDLVRFLADTRVPLEVCPTSNLRTGVVSHLDRHPVWELIAAGCAVTVNTDDPAMFGCTLDGEYELLACRLDDGAIREVAGAAIEASWAAEPRRVELRRLLETWWKSRGC